SAKLKLPAILVGLVDAFHRSVMTAIALVQLAKIGEAPVIHAAPALGDESQAIVHHSVSGRCFNAAFSRMTRPPAAKSHVRFTPENGHSAACCDNPHPLLQSTKRAR